MQDHEAALVQVSVHLMMLAPVALPPIARRGVATLASLAHAAVHDDADTLLVAELALQVVVELRIVSRDDEDLSELHHLLPAFLDPVGNVHAPEEQERGHEILFGAVTVAREAHRPSEPQLDVGDDGLHAELL